MAKRGVLAVVAVLALLLVGIVVLGSVFKLPGLRFLSVPGVGGGLTISSIDCGLLYGVSEAELKTKKCTVNAYGDRGGQYLSGEYTESRDKSGNAITKPIRIELSTSKEVVRYGIRNDYTEISAFIPWEMLYDNKADKSKRDQADSIFSCTGYPGLNTIEGNLFAELVALRKTMPGWPVGGGEMYIGKVCAYRRSEGVLGTLRAPTVTHQGTFKVSAGGETYNLNFDSLTQRSFQTSDGRVLIKIPGDLLTGNSPPPAWGFRPVWIEAYSSWGLANPNDITALIAARGDLEQDISKWGTTYPLCNLGDYYDVCTEPPYTNEHYTNIPAAADRIFKTMASRYHNQLQIVSQQDFALTDDFGNKFFREASSNVGSKNDGYIDISLDRWIENPVFVLEVSADWLGVVAPVGKPKIVSLASQIFSGGTYGTIMATVTNEGSGQGSFVFKVSGCDPIVQVASTVIGFRPGEIQTVPIQIQGAAGGTKACTVTVTEYNSPSVYTSGQVSVTSVVAPEECLTGERRPSGATIVECRNGKWQIVATCSSTDIRPTGTNEWTCAESLPQPPHPPCTSTDCAPPPPPPKVCLKSDPWCQLSGLLMKNWMWIAAAIIVAIVAGVLYRAQSPLAGTVLVGGLGLIAAAMFAVWLLGQWWFWLLLVVGIVVYARGKLS